MKNLKKSFAEKKRRALAEIVEKDIAQAAARLFVQKGYAQTTMDDIAEAIGMSKANLYNYVSSKHVVIFIILEHHVKEVENIFNSIGSLRKNMSAREKLRKFIRDYIELVDKTQDEAIALHHAVVRLDKEGRRKFLKSAIWMFDFVEAMLDEGIKSGEYVQHNTKILSPNIVKICTDWAHLRWYFRNMFTVEEYIIKQTELVEKQIIREHDSGS